MIYTDETTYLDRRIVHWLQRVNSLKSFCGIFAPLNTTHKEKVTCRNCLRLMKLHTARLSRVILECTMRL
jgi:hypothetical protein